MAIEKYYWIIIWVSVVSTPPPFCFQMIELADNFLVLVVHAMFCWWLCLSPGLMSCTLPVISKTYVLLFHSVKPFSNISLGFSWHLFPIFQLFQLFRCQNIFVFFSWHFQTLHLSAIIKLVSFKRIHYFVSVYSIPL